MYEYPTKFTDNSFKPVFEKCKFEQIDSGECFLLYKGGDIYIKTWTIRNAEHIDDFSDDIDEKYDVNAIRLYCGIPTFIEDDEEVFPLKVNINYSQYLIKE